MNKELVVIALTFGAVIAQPALAQVRSTDTAVGHSSVAHRGTVEGNETDGSAIGRTARPARSGAMPHALSVAVYPAARPLARQAPAARYHYRHEGAQHQGLAPTLGRGRDQMHQFGPTHGYGPAHGFAPPGDYAPAHGYAPHGWHRAH